MSEAQLINPEAEYIRQLGDAFIQIAVDNPQLQTDSISPDFSKINIKPVFDVLQNELPKIIKNVFNPSDEQIEIIKSLYSKEVFLAEREVVINFIKDYKEKCKIENEIDSYDTLTKIMTFITKLFSASSTSINTAFSTPNPGFENNKRYDLVASGILASFQTRINVAILKAKNS